MSNNGFKRMEEEYKLPEELKKKTYKQVEGNVGVVRFVFRVIELYVPRLFSILVPEHQAENAATEEKGMSFAKSYDKENESSDDEKISSEEDLT